MHLVDEPEMNNMRIDYIDRIRDIYRASRCTLSFALAIYLVNLFLVYMYLLSYKTNKTSIVYTVA